MIKIKNIWHLFYILFSFISILFLYIAYLSYSFVFENNKTITSSYNKILYNSLDTTLSQNEVLLDILAKELIEYILYKDQDKAKRLIQRVLLNSKYLIGFQLTDTQGNLLVTSVNIDTSKLPNILRNEEVNTTFEEVLKSDKMVVGQTYYFAPLKTWLIPITKAIYDKEGNVVAVMTAGVVNNRETNIFSGIELYNDRTITLLRDFDKNNQLYTLYCSEASAIHYEDTYSTNLDKKTYQSFMKNLNKEFKIVNLDAIRDGNIYYTTARVSDDTEDIFLAISYNKKYKIWVIVSQKKSFLYSWLLDSLFYVAVLYLFIVFMFYFLFRAIDNKEKEKKAQLIYKANHDSLTGYYNRDYIGNNQSVVESLKRKDFEVIFLDLDNFKNINNRFGHRVGDKVLIAISMRLSKFFNQDDIMIRHGGDEFIILSFSPVHFNELIELISAVCYVDDLEFRLGVSIGVCRHPQDSVNFDELFSMADIAMHEAKKVRNSYRYFNQKMYKKSIENSDTEHQLRHALYNEEFYMVYQPQISRYNDIYGVEALIRWKNKKLGFIPPDKFIGIAEDNGMILKIGEWILRQSLSDIKEVWELTGLKFHLSLNISVIQIMQQGFLDQLLNLLAEVGIDKTYITLEITESLAIEEFHYVILLLNKARENGIDISLDDFGTGYSSLSMLKKLPISELKIDKQFIDDLEKGKKNALIKSIFSIGKNFSFKIVCEGAQTKEQVDILKEYGCDVFQGYYFSKPLKKEDLIAYIKEFND